jgi:hypothetical protein
VKHGSGQKIVPSADWAFIAELATPDDLHTWLSSDAHRELLDKIIPIKAEVASIQLDL